MSVGNVISTWRFKWRMEQKKNGFPSENEQWEAYVNSLTNHEILKKLMEHDDDY